MAFSVRSAQAGRSAAAFALLAMVVAAPGCVDIVAGIDGSAKYLERDEKHFTTTGKPDVVVSTFDGSIEIRPWDKADVQIVVEKRGHDKDDVSVIDVRAEQSGNRIEVSVTEPKHMGIHFNNRSAKLIVSMPASGDVAAKSGDGSIDIERIAGKVQLRSGDGSIRGWKLADVTAHTGDGSIKLEDVNGPANVDTGDGSITLGGKLTNVHARSGDGGVTIHVEPGSTPDGDWDIATGDGSVTLELPDDFGAEIDARTGDGSVRMQDLTLSNVTSGKGKNAMRGRLGAGGPAVRVRSGDGSITLRRS